MKSSMNSRNPVALAVATAVSLSAAAMVPTVAAAAGKTPGTYVAGDFHNHTTCSDGTISMEKLIGKATGTTGAANGTFGLDWFVQAGHGGNGNRNCTLVEDDSLSTPAYPYLAGYGPTTTWENSPTPIVPKGDVSGAGPSSHNMWRWQSIQEFQYPLVEYFNAYKNLPLFIGIETVAPGHEHVSMSVITGQIPAALDTATLPSAPPYLALGNASTLAKWEYCFDRSDTDTSRGVGNNWDCSVPGSANSANPSWNAVGHKLITPGSGTGSGTLGHAKTIEALKWMAAYEPNTSYYVPAHLERAGPFVADGVNGFNVESLRDLNNAAPTVAFGFESQPGHGASANRGEYQVLRQTINGVPTDSVGGTTYGGTGVYAGRIGGVWDALLGEGRNWWFFASSDWHNRGSFGPDDARSTQDFLPGEYQRTYAMVRKGSDKIRPQTVVNGLRSGNTFSSSGQIIDRLAFIACVSYPGLLNKTNAAVEALAVAAATSNTDIDNASCATMGEKLKVKAGAEIVVSVVVRDPSGTNNAPYVFDNPSLLQVGLRQPINQPVLDHVDLIRGLVSGYRTPGAANYSGTWPLNKAWLHDDGTTPSDLSNVPDAAKNTSAAVIKTFSGASPWTQVTASDGSTFLKMTYRVPAVSASQYLRLRGTNMPASVPYETDANGNPLADVYTNANDPTRLTIPCTTVGTNVPTTPATTTYSARDINGCPAHLAVAASPSPIAGQKAVSYDVAAWSDLWFYSNPIYVEVTGGQVVAGVQ